MIVIEWAGYLAIGFFTLIGVFQFGVAIWAAFTLKRKPMPELSGIDWLDLLYRLESAFRVTFEREDSELIPAERRTELTAGDLLDLVAAKLQRLDRPVPADSWELIVSAITEALNVAAARVQKTSKLRGDLGLAVGF